MRHLIYIYTVCAVLSVLGLTACSDDNGSDSPIPEQTGPVKLDEQEVDIGSEGRYYSVTATADSLAQVHATTDADWIELDADTVNRAGTLLFYVKPNEEARSRDGIITLQLGDNPQTSIVKVHQHSQAEDDENSLPGGALTRQSRVGYGYNMLIDYVDPKSVTEQILDYEKLVKAEKTWGTIIAEEGRALQGLSVKSSYSIEEMSSWMSEQTTTETKILFWSKKVQKYNKVKEYNLDQRTYGYSTLYKTIATRYVDEGKLESILRKGGDVFTADFRKLYQQVNTNPTKDNIAALVKKYGTHMVIYTDLGGRMDYMVNFRSEETSRESVERYLKYKNGSKKEDKESKEASHNIITSGDGLAFDIYGGSEAAIKALAANAKTKDAYGQVDQGLLGQWINSIKSSDPSSVSMVRCTLLPIWQLITNSEARANTISYILALARQEGGDLAQRLEELSLGNYYRFNITNDMQKWGTDTKTSLVRLAYFDNAPKAEICNEYVPELRGDRRVTLFYPIYKGKTNIRRGIFPGDGENPPAEVMFDTEGGCYVRPIDGFKAGDKLTTLYYIDGAFYTDNMGIQIPEVKMMIRDHKVDFAEGGNNYPVVKIGPGYWIRYNITGTMEFGEPMDPDDPECYDYDLKEEQRHDMLYTNVFWGNSLAYRWNHPGWFDADVDEFGNRIHWYVPRVKDIQTLQTYLGNNTKALFPGMQSGFEAQFAGYYGPCDDLNNGKDIGWDEHYYNKYCFIISKEVVTNSGESLVLGSDYTVRRLGTNRARDNWYPLRAYRSSYYNYNANLN